MIERVARDRSLPANVTQNIIERTDGIPLFIEEITKTALEVAGTVNSERTLAGIPPPSLAVPPTLQASLMARLDRLGPAQGVAQIGAVIGREFNHTLLAAVAQRSEQELKSA